MTITLTRDEALAKMESIHARINDLSGKARLSKADNAEFARASEEFQELEDHIAKLDRAATIAACAGEGGGGGSRLDRGGVNPYAAERHATSPQRDAALRQLERSVKAATLTDAGATVVERLLDAGPEHESSWLQRWVTDTGDHDYVRAFAKLVALGEQRAGLEFSPAERAAFDRVSRLKAEQRAMGEGSGPAGSYLVPFELDPSIILTSGGSTNPILQVARVISTYSDVWHGVSSDGVVAEWLAEAAEASDASPTLAEPAIPAWKMSAYVEYSVELEGDAVNLVSELGRLLTDAANQLLASAFAAGSGTGQPQGIVTALAASSSKLAATTADTLTAGDAYRLQNALPPRWQPTATWAGNLATINTLRQFTTPNGSLSFPGLQQDPPVLLGRKIIEVSNMDGTIDAGQDNNLLIYGDWSNYVVTQRVGSAVEFIPWVVGTNRRPVGKRGLWLWSRWGGGCVNPNAFRLLQA